MQFLVGLFIILTCLFKRLQNVLNFTPSILNFEFESNIHVKNRVSQSKSCISATLFTRIPTWNHLGICQAFFGFDQPLTAWEVAKDVGLYSVFVNKLQMGLDLNLETGFKSWWHTDTFFSSSVLCADNCLVHLASYLIWNNLYCLR
jgi:hypothetical protein